MLRNGLAATELALATMLLIAAGLLIQSLVELQRVRLGFEPKGVLTFQLSPPPAKYPPDGKAQAFYRELIESLRGIPRVRAAGVSSENIFEKRQGPQTFAGSPGNCDSRKPSSVADHGAAISGEPHVEFEPITAVLKGQVEGRDGIFSNGKRARTQTAVSKKKRGLHRASF